MQEKGRGFTLIELLIAITIIATISAVGFVSYSRSQVVARDAKRKQDLRAIQIAMEVYRAKNGLFPNSAPSAKSVLSNDSSVPSNWDNLFKVSVSDPAANYINKMPTDPINSTSGSTLYVYGYNSTDGTNYTLCARLENTNDPDRIPSSGTCTVTSGSTLTGNYQVTYP